MTDPIRRPFPRDAFDNVPLILDLRTYIAAQTLAAYLTSEPWDTIEQGARYAVQAADALIAELNKDAE